MATHRHIGRICLAALALAVLVCAGLFWARAAGVRGSHTPGYQNRLFDSSAVHSIDIRMEDWEDFLAGCEDEAYVSCTVLIDNELYKNIGLRAKGNTSLSQVSAYGSGRYSFKLEFDHYESGRTYYGLDKLCLNNLIQDNTLLKDYLCYTMMADMGVSAPLCSYVWVTVNGQPFGLYLAVEGIEDGFLYRNYGGQAGQLYKPDSVSMGGGRGAGRDFVWQQTESGETRLPENLPEGQPPEGAQMGAGLPDALPPEGLQLPGDMPQGQLSDGLQMGEGLPGAQPPEGQLPGGPQSPGDMPEELPGGAGRFGAGQDGSRGQMGGFAADDVLLCYTDDDAQSYPNIFQNAKTSGTAADQTRLIAALRSLDGQNDLEAAVDTDRVIRYFAVHNFVCSFDSYTGSMVHNYYLYEQDGRLAMIPWDYNLAFGAFGSQSSAQTMVNYPIDTPVSGLGVEARPMLRWIFADAAYTAQYHAALQQLIDRWFAQGRFAAEIDRLAALLDGYAAQDTSAFCSYDEWQTALDALRQFGDLRAQSVSAQLAGRIPAAQEQRTASDVLIDTGSLRLTDMGGMGMGGGFGGSGGFAGDDPGSGFGGRFGGGMPGFVDGNIPDGSPSDGSDSPGSVPDFGGGFGSNVPGDTPADGFGNDGPGFGSGSDNGCGGGFGNNVPDGAFPDESGGSANMPGFGGTPDDGFADGLENGRPDFGGGPDGDFGGGMPGVGGNAGDGCRGGTPDGIPSDDVPADGSDGSSPGPGGGFTDGSGKGAGHGMPAQGADTPSAEGSSLPADGRFPQMMPDAAGIPPTANGKNAAPAAVWLWAGLCAAALAGGFVFVLRWQRR